LNPDQLSILQPELHRAPQTAALNGLFNHGIVFGLQFSLLGCDRGVNGNFGLLTLRRFRVQVQVQVAIFASWLLPPWCPYRVPLGA
jgi:hypothetical protein